MYVIQELALSPPVAITVHHFAGSHFQTGSIDHWLFSQTFQISQYFQKMSTIRVRAKPLIEGRKKKKMVSIRKKLKFGAAEAREMEARRAAAPFRVHFVSRNDTAVQLQFQRAQFIGNGLLKHLCTGTSH